MKPIEKKELEDKNKQQSCFVKEVNFVLDNKIYEYK